MIPTTSNRLCRLSTFACVGFLILSAAAMVAYPGGTPADHAATHYQFFHNPFSDLGRTRAFDGRANRIAMPLFIAAMSAGGVGLSAFFIAFAGAARRTVLSRVLGVSSAILGTAAGACFVGVACTPWDVYMRPHMRFVFAAFRCLLVATLLAASAVVADGTLGKRMLVPFALFAGLLVTYLALLTAGVGGDGAMSAAVVQATGQKLIAGAAMSMVIVEASLVRRGA